MRFPRLRALGRGIVKSLPRVLSPPLTGGSWNGFGEWWGTIKEPFTGAWQRNIEWCADGIISNPTVYACITLKAGDIGKLPVKLMRRQSNGIRKETSSPAFSPVLRRPNRYQNSIEFLQQWVVSCEFRGNTYVLKERDNRGIVVAMYVLDPNRVQPMIATDGSIFYQLQPENLVDLPESVTVPASEIIHDKVCPLFHPLVGTSPIFAAGLAAAQSQEIARNSASFFKNGSRVGGILTAPGALDPKKAEALKEKWEAGFTGVNAGKTAVLADGMKFQQLTMTAVDAQLIDQLKWDDEKICECFHVPGYKVGVGGMPPYGNLAQLNMDYLQSALQLPISRIEACLKEGLSLPDDYEVWLDESELLRMDELARWEVYAKAIGCGGMKPNEARAREWLDPVAGGDQCYLQQQNFSLEALAKRDQREDPFDAAKVPPAALPASESDPNPAPDAPDDGEKAFLADLTKHIVAGISEIEYDVA
jgi:HK97 family phage portal protein